MKYYLWFLFIVIAPLSAEIIEAKHFGQLLEQVSKNDLVVIDIDDTLLIPKQMLGCDIWFMERLKTHENKNMGSDAALDKALAEWEAVRHLSEMLIVEEGNDQVIDHLQKKGIIVMGLTTQGLALANRTIRQLAAVGIDLITTAPTHKDDYFINGVNGVLFRQGILFTAGTHKGKALRCLLDRLEYHPKRVVFINDKASHLKEVEEVMELEGISFLGLRYGYSDEKKRSYRSDVAEVQFKQSTFVHILTDEEALSILEAKGA